MPPKSKGIYAAHSHNDDPSAEVTIAREAAGKNQDKESYAKSYVSQRRVFESKMQEPQYPHQPGKPDPIVQEGKNVPGHKSWKSETELRVRSQWSGQLAVKDKGFLTVPSPVAGLKLASVKNTRSLATFPS